MKYLNATQAANRLGISDKTMRRWLKEEKFKLHAVRTPSHELMIAEDEIERVKRERAEYASNQGEETTGNAPELIESALAGRVEELERQIAELRAELAGMHQGRQSATTDATERPVRAIATNASTLPEGAILARRFAELYAVSPGTFRGHYEIGLGKDREKAPISSREDTARSDGKMQWYVMPEQREQVLDYWRRHGVKFHEGVNE